jgi:hypothetical protein
MNETMTEEEIDKLTADVKQIHKDAEHIKNPIELYDPSSKVGIISEGTPEWEARQELKKQWLKDNPPPPSPPCRYHISTDPRTEGDWEMRYATEEQLAAKRGGSQASPRSSNTSSRPSLIQSAGNGPS